MEDYRESWLGWKDLPKHKEGNTGLYPKYQKYLINLIQDLNPKVILETGFNAGHSACCFLNGAPSAKMYTFDICRWGTEHPALEVLKQHFDIQLIEGDSRKTLPNFIQENSDITVDFIFIDGGHSGNVPFIDIKESMSILNVGGIIFVDDGNAPDVVKAISQIDWSDYEKLEVPPLNRQSKTEGIEKLVFAYKKIK